MITELTKDQERKMGEYRDIGLSIGLNTDRITLKETIPIIHGLQEHVLLRKKTPVVVLDNPIQAWLAVCMFSCDGDQILNQVGGQVVGQVRDQVVNHVWCQVGRQVGSCVGEQVWDQVGKQVRGQIRYQVGRQVGRQAWDQVRDHVDDQVLSNVGIQVWDHVGSQVREQVWNKVRDQIRDQVWGQVGDRVWKQIGWQIREQVWQQIGSQVDYKATEQVEDQVWHQFKNFIYPYLDGSFFSYFKAFYDYMGNVLGVKGIINAKYNALCETCKLGLIYPLENICIVSQKPIEINMKGGLLHKDGGPSIKYAGGFNVWSLNGIRVPQYLAETPAGELDINFWKKEKNADIKAEFVRKYGVERMLSECTLMDTYKNYDNSWWTKSEYELYDAHPLYANLTKHNRCPHLKMLNQSTGIWHVEGVSPNCNNIDQALMWRESNKNNYETITIK